MRNASNNGYKNEDLIVWMRAAAFPSFRKFYRRIDHFTTGNIAGDDDSEEKNAAAPDTELFTSGLPAGNYTLTVGYGWYITLHQQTGDCLI